MRTAVPLLALTLATLTNLCHCCQKISVESDITGETLFTKLSSTLSGSLGRSSYISIAADGEENQYLYYSIADVNAGTGRWIINGELGVDDHATAFVESWAVEPYLVGSVNDGADLSRWQVSSNDGFKPDGSMSVFCLDDAGDLTVYFESSHLSPSFAGFYVVGGSDDSSSPAPKFYSHVRLYESYYPILFLYKMADKWMIGENVGDDACLSFVIDDAMAAHEIVSSDWRFANTTDPNQNFSWTIEYSSIISKHTVIESELKAENVYHALREVRSLPSVPDKQEYVTLRHGMPMPTIGLGTGGLYEGAETLDTFRTALKLGYRLFDLAREYNNEEAFATVLKEVREEEELYRNEVFIESKVWPTDLGFNATTEAIETSLELLDTNYIDLYLLHWPACNQDIDWMHCEETIDPEGTWRESWRALEKAYAEGRVMSIGVSNFNKELLIELLDFAAVRPHVVQNFAEPGSVDLDVRKWCHEHEVLYQPYASIRNLKDLPGHLHNALHRIAAEKAVSAHSVAIRFFIQSGTGVIPRSKDASHLRENLEAFGYELSDAEMAELGWHSEL